MEVWDTIKEGFEKAFGEVELKAKELKENLNEEFQVLKLRRELDSVKKEVDLVHQKMGEQIHEKMDLNEEISIDLFKQDISYMTSLKEKHTNIQKQMNYFYQENKKDTKQSLEIIIDKKDMVTEKPESKEEK
ncbi:MAG: hypothetical protein COB02_08275 [Candidatus Cloacimonadota bacterium]|nr:MAG: hypothetical protein COB02_08275 [Candidatus Cloacimonadota bacterium]